MDVSDGLEVRLRDGTRALIRPIRPHDKWRLQEGLRLLSPTSRYLRFHAAIDHFTAAQLRYLTEIDYTDHMAWVALNPADGSDPGMGVARYVRLKDEPTVAEAAVTVVDRHQGKGLGSILLTMLAQSAIGNGIRILRSFVLSENRGMLELLDELGATEVRLESPGVYQVDAPLPDDPDQLPDTPAMRILRASARGRLPAFRVLLPRSAESGE